MKGSRMQAGLSYLAKPLFGGIGHILMYHRVVDNLPTKKSMGARIETSKSHFENQLDYFINHHYQFFSMDEVFFNLQQKTPSKNFVSITFDDGYKDNLTIAYPILKKRGIPFCVYITTDFPDRKAILWWYLFEDLFNRNQSINISYHGAHFNFDCSSPQMQQQVELKLRRMIKTCPPHLLKELLKEMFEHNHVELFQKTRQLVLSWEEIKLLSQDPLVTIGAHSIHHHALNILSDSELMHEYRMSRRAIENVIAKPVLHFAYPYGSKSEAGIREFKKADLAGYNTAVTSRMANVFPEHRNHLTALPRLEMPLLEDKFALQMAVNGLIQAKRYRLRRVIWDN